MAFPERLSKFNKVGKLFFIDEFIQIPVSSTKFFLLKTNESVINIEAINISGNAGTSIVTTFIDSNISSNGTNVVTHRYNRTIEPSDDYSTAECFLDPIVTDNGIKLLAAKTFGSIDKKDVLSSSSAGGGDFEIVLKENQFLLIKFENTDASNIADYKINLQWIEEKIKEI